MKQLPRNNPLRNKDNAGRREGRKGGGEGEGGGGGERERERRDSEGRKGEDLTILIDVIRPNLQLFRSLISWLRKWLDTAN